MSWFQRGRFCWCRCGEGVDPRSRSEGGRSELESREKWTEGQAEGAKPRGPIQAEPWGPVGQAEYASGAEAKSAEAEGTMEKGRSEQANPGADSRVPIPGGGRAPEWAETKWAEAK